MSDYLPTSTDHLPALADGHGLAAPHAGDLRWADVVALYLTNASRSGSENTRRAYRRHLEAFAAVPLEVGGAALPPIHHLGDVTAVHLMGWRAYIMGRDGLSAGSRAQAIAALRGFMRYAGTQGWHTIPSDRWRENLTMPPADAERPFSVLSDVEVVRILEAVEQDLMEAPPEESHTLRGAFQVAALFFMRVPWPDELPDLHAPESEDVESFLASEVVEAA